MRLLRLLVAVAAVTVLVGGPALAQTTPPTGQKPPATPPAQPPAQPPATPPAPQAAPPAAPRPYPEGAKIAYIDIQAVAANSADGKVASGKIQDLVKKKSTEIQDKNKQLEAARNKQQTSGGIMNDAARLQLEKEIDKLTREVQYAQQEAQADQNALQAELQVEFQRKLTPILEQIAKEKNLHMLVDIQNSGALWVDTGLDLTQEVIKRLDANKTPAAPKK